MPGSHDTLVRAQAGDHSAFAELVREHQSMVFGIACHFLRDRAVAEELAQDTFLELYQRLESIKSLDHLKFWLRRVVGNRCIDASRRRRLRPVVGLEDVPEPAAIEAREDPILAETLRRYVGALPETARLVVVLRFQEDLSPSEIADVLEMPLNTVKSHLQRSLAMLREKLARCLGEVPV